MHPLTLSSARATLLTNPHYPSVSAVLDSFRPTLSGTFEASKARLEASPVIDAAEDLHLNAFLHSQGFDPDALAEDEDLRTDFLRVTSLVQNLWATETEQLMRAYRDLQQRTSAVLRDQVPAFVMSNHASTAPAPAPLLMRVQAATRPVLEAEETLRQSMLQRKWAILRAQLRQRITSELIEYARAHWRLSHRNAQQRERRNQKRALDQNSVQILQKWWDAHADDPYPTEEVRAAH